MCAKEASVQKKCTRKKKMYDASSSRARTWFYLGCIRNIRDTDFCTVTGQSDWCDTKQNWCVCEVGIRCKVRRNESVGA